MRSNNLVGDIFHRLPSSAGKYNLAGVKGHLNLRFINLRTIPGLGVLKPHGQQGYYDREERLIQDRNSNKIKFLDIYYHHATHLQRSITREKDKLVPKRPLKLKYELGEKVPQEQIPEIFFADKPEFVPKVTNPASVWFWVRSAMETIPRRVKRLLLPTPDGY